MTGFVVPFRRRPVLVRGWTPDELGEFYRVEAAMIKAGLPVVSDQGVSDEGDPWFVFCHDDPEQDVIIHFARVAGGYLVNAASLGSSLTGGDFKLLVRQVLDRYAAVADRRSAATDNKVVLLPSTVLWVLIAIAFLKSAELRAAETNASPHAPATAGLPPPPDGLGDVLPVLVAYATQALVAAAAGTAGLATQAAFADPASPIAHAIPAAVALPDDIHVAASAEPHPGIVAPPADPPPHGPDILPHPADAALPALASFGAEGLVHPAAAAVLPATVLAIPAVPAIPDAAAIPSGFAALAVLQTAETGLPLKLVEPVAALPPPIAAVLLHTFHVATGEDAQHAQQGLLEGMAADQPAIPLPLPHPATPHPVAAAEAHDPAPAAVTPDAPPATILHPVVPDPAPAAPHADASVAQPVPADPGAAHPAVPPAPLASPPVQPVVAPAPALFSQPAPVTAMPGSGAAAPPALDAAKLALAVAAVHEFLLEVPLSKVISDHSNLVVYDAFAVNTDLLHVQALTFDMSDGTHVSLVGLPTELSHALAGHP